MFRPKVALERPPLLRVEQESAPDRNLEQMELSEFLAEPKRGRA